MLENYRSNGSGMVFFKARRVMVSPYKGRRAAFRSQLAARYFTVAVGSCCVPRVFVAQARQGDGRFCVPSLFLSGWNIFVGTV